MLENNILNCHRCLIVGGIHRYLRFVHKNSHQQNKSTTVGTHKAGGLYREAGKRGRQARPTDGPIFSLLPLAELTRHTGWALKQSTSMTCLWWC